MVSIIKNQLLKHLSRYTKNLSSDKINLSTFRGEGELSNLQLDENVLTDLLELPSWLRLTSAWCNHVSFRIHWTKLKSVPIILSLDEVNITVETCEIARTGTPTHGIQSLAAPQGKYSFIHKVIDGITIIVNTVNVNFKSPAFTASVQMSRIRVESKTPKWSHGDLHVTRLKSPTQILIFKELSWQTVRIEASSTQDKTLTPLRLLTNQARCRITIKKRLSDCSVVSSILVLILDDLLWVLTDSQLKAALHFVDSLSGLIQTSTNVTQRTKAQRKLETLPEYQAQIAQQSKQKENIALTPLQKTFNLFDVKETSYHFFSQRIDLHLCDDVGDGRSCHPELKEGGALQISVQGFQIDYYPYHLAKSDRTHWPKYKDAAVPPALWLEQSLNTFRESLLNLSNPTRPSAHAPLERTFNLYQQKEQVQQQQQQQQTPSSPNSDKSIAQQQLSPMKKHILDNLSKLMSACVILRVEDFTLYRVTTSGKKQMPKEFIGGDKDRYSFPPDLPTIHAEFTYFYYPGDFVFPLPPSKVFLHLNPIQIYFDVDSCLWLSSFALNLHESLLRTNVGDTMNLNSPTNSNEPSLMYMDVKLEAIMPRIIFEAAVEVPSQRDRPKSMQVQISRFAITNIREMGASRADLAQALHALQEGSLVFGSGFPSKDGDLCIVTDRILSHVAATDMTQTTPLSTPNSYSTTSILTRHALWSEPRDVWCIKLDPVWIDFYGARSIGTNRSIPFVDAVPITLWLHGKPFEKKPEEPFLHMNLPKDKENLNSSSIILSVSNLQQSLGTNSSTDIMNNQLTNHSNYNNPFITNEFTLNNSDNCSNLFCNDNLSEGNIKPTQLDLNFQDRKEINNENNDDTTADLHIITHVANLVSVQIDHYQFLFLLRLSEELTELSTFLSLDSQRILKERNVDKTIIVGCVVPQVEVTLVMPSPTPGKESSGGDAESVLPDSASLGDDLHMNSSTSMWPTTTPPPNDLTRNPLNHADTLSPLTNEATFDIPHTSNPNTHGYNVQIQSVPSSVQGTSTAMPLAANNKNKNRNSTTDTIGISKEINSGLLSMKKGFTNFMTSIDSALKPNANDDISDTFSMHSDMSSDSENYIMVIGDTDKTADCMDVMFRLNPFTNDNTLKVSPVEVASEVYEEPQYKTNMSSPSEPSETSSCKRRDLVSMVTFRLTTVELLRQMRGTESSLCIQVSAINCDECGAIPWDEFQNKFGTRCKAWNIATYNPDLPPCIKIRFEEELKPPANISNIHDKKSVLSWFYHMVDVRVSDLNLQLSMSTVIGLGDLAEDEIIPKPLPMKILLENLRLNLIEDRPPVNITSPGPVPINLHIGKMLVKRDLSGVFNIEPLNQTIVKETKEKSNDVHKNERDRELLSIQLILQQLKIDNENLKKHITVTEKLQETTRNKSKQETDILKTYLKAAQDDITTLLDEKRTLLDTVRTLQQQLTAKDMNLKNDGNR